MKGFGPPDSEPRPDGGAVDADGIGAGQSGSAVAACGSFPLTSSLSLAPAAAGQPYVRCDTLGPEGGWQVTPSPSGRFLAARTGAGTVRLVATQPWHEVAELASPLGVIDAVAFSPDETLLATLSAEMGEVALWRTQGGALDRSFGCPPGSTIDASASALAFSSDGGRLATSLGTTIDLGISGTTTSWKTGAAASFILTVNPENLGTGEGIPLIRFTAGDAGLFIWTTYQIGNSPTSARLELRDPATGQQTVLYDFYDRGLGGFALSPDGTTIALADSQEAASGAGVPAGLRIVDARTGGQLANDVTFTGTVLGFSPDSQRVYTLSDTTVSGRDATTLATVSQFPWTARASFLGVAPGGDLVGSTAGATTWRDPVTGAVTRTLAFPLTAVASTADGLHGVGSGDPAALFHFWREADGAALCAPAAGTDTTPPMTSFGTTPVAGGNILTSADGTVTVTDAAGLHDHAVNYLNLQVTDTATGALIRQYGDVANGEAFALEAPSATRIYTSQGNDVAVWCR